VDFMPESEFRRRFDRAVERRIRDLAALGVPRRDARQQAEKEFAVCDLFEIDDRGWVRLTGLDLSED
jgi:hypothetical protein